jgi:hypothetical protein
MLLSIAVLLSTFPFRGFAEAPVTDTDFSRRKTATGPIVTVQVGSLPAVMN